MNEKLRAGLVRVGAIVTGVVGLGNAFLDTHLPAMLDIIGNHPDGAAIALAIYFGGLHLARKN